MPHSFSCFNLLTVMLAGWITRDQRKVIEYLLAENRVYRERLGRTRLCLTDDQRRLLAVKGKVLGRKLLADVASIVTPDTILRWHRRLIAKKWDTSDRRKKQGRPTTAEEIAKLIVKFAQENPDWGYTRIGGALANLGHTISRTTIAGILKAHGLEPAPDRPTRWRDFLTAHWESLAACDFLTAEVWTLQGLTTFYILVAIELGSRRVKIAGVTTEPRSVWMRYAAEHMVVAKDGDAEQAFLADAKYLVHDRDTKFCRSFSSVLAEHGVETVKLPARSPNLNGYTACCTSLVRWVTTSGNRRRSDSLRPWLLAGAA
jgi:hypothetical protein